MLRLISGSGFEFECLCTSDDCQPGDASAGTEKGDMLFIRFEHEAVASMVGPGWLLRRMTWESFVPLPELTAWRLPDEEPALRPAADFQAEKRSRRGVLSTAELATAVSDPHVCSLTIGHSLSHGDWNLLRAATNVRSLSIHGSFGREGLASLSRMEWLTELQIHGADFKGADFPLLRRIEGLRLLGLNSCGVTDTIVDYLEVTTTLRTLDLSSPFIWMTFLLSQQGSNALAGIGG
ncbi:MAG: hypothetical protein KF774_10575 [Planctomyces sp.]|nr:hypothetical protein [Planctomyces sp.]